MKIKICGITQLEDAKIAVDLGAWALGFVFYSKSPRAIQPTKAAELISKLPGSVLKVGVFVDMPAEEVKQIQKNTGIDILQFHGDETADDCNQFGIPYFKSFHLRNLQDLSKPKSYLNAMAVLVDSQTKQQKGGTGICADWSLAAQIERPPQLILAGGLNAQNIQQAVDEVAPDAVDVSSGVEDFPGKKSKEKLEKFFKEAML